MRYVDSEPRVTVYFCLSSNCSQAFVGKRFYLVLAISSSKKLKLSLSFVTHELLAKSKPVSTEDIYRIQYIRSTHSGNE